MDVGEPSFTTDTGDIHGGSLYVYGLGFFFGFVFLIIVSYICKRHMCSRTPPSLTTNDAEGNHRVITFSQGLDDDTLVTFPTFIYSEFTTPQMGEGSVSGCYICLSDYKPVDAVRLLPECGHLFHVRCIDTWLKVHPTCPVCRKSLIVV